MQDMPSAENGPPMQIFPSIWRTHQKDGTRGRLPIGLSFTERSKIAEISKMIGKSSSAVKMRLQKGRKLLREAYGKESI